MALWNFCIHSAIYKQVINLILIFQLVIQEKVHNLLYRIELVQLPYKHLRLFLLMVLLLDLVQLLHCFFTASFCCYFYLYYYTNSTYTTILILLLLLFLLVLVQPLYQLIRLPKALLLFLGLVQCLLLLPPIATILTSTSIQLLFYCCF